MNKRLTAKIQELNSELQQYQSNFSNIIIAKPEVEELLLKKGSLYAVFNISGETDFDTQLVTKVVNDVLQNAYYQSTNISPIQSLETAIVQVRDKIAQLPNEALKNLSQTFKFNIISAALWGNVLYIVQYGEAACFVVKEDGTHQVNMLSEGSFAAATSVLKDGDVVILATKQFSDEFPPQKLLTSAISNSELKPGEGCLLVKLIVDSEFTANEIVDFGMEEPIQVNKANIAGKRVLQGIKTRFSTLKTGLTKATISRQMSKRPQKGPQVFTIQPDEKKKKSLTKVILPVLIVAFLGSIFFTLKNRQAPKKEVRTENQTLGDKTSDSVKPVNTAEDTSTDQTTKTKRVSPEALYDIKLVDAEAEPTDLAVFDSYIVAVDKNKGSIFTSPREGTKFTKASATFSGIHSVSNYGGKLTFSDNEGYKAVAVPELTIADQMKLDRQGITATYTDLVYQVSGDSLYRYKKNGDSVENILWGQSTDFVNTSDFAVAFSIYTVTNDGKVHKYTAGKEDTFEIKGLDKGLVSPVKIVADIDLDNIYIADKGNDRVVVIDKNGNLVAQYKPVNSNVWDDIRSLDVSEDEKTIYVLNGSKVYEIKAQ